MPKSMKRFAARLMAGCLGLAAARQAAKWRGRLDDARGGLLAGPGSARLVLAAIEFVRRWRRGRRDRVGTPGEWQP